MLKLYIKSFSYKLGMPQAVDKHGGGFVFDCRALPNPGRESEFKQLTGCDVPVKKYIEDQHEAKKFFDCVLELVLQSVNNYKLRGFESLSVYFGCTGGQHRSVYFAEKLAEYFRGDPQIEIDKVHINMPKQEA